MAFRVFHDGRGLEISEPVAVRQSIIDNRHAGWERLCVSRIEDFHDAVKGAGLDAVQLSRGPMTGSLAYAVHEGVTFTSGQIGGKVRLSGPLSETMITLGVGINLAPGSRHWMRDVETGGIGVFMAGDEHDAVYTPGTLYAAATMPAEWLERRAAEIGCVLDARQLGGTGISERRVAEGVTRRLQASFGHVHSGHRNSGYIHARGGPCEGIGFSMLDAIIRVLARSPRTIPPHDSRAGRGRIVARSLEYIREHLDEPIYISSIACAACASHSTLYRAFHCVLDETPQSYVRKLRLHRIRHDLASDVEARCTIATIANRWGMTELGRLAGWYRDAFGELPSETRSRNVRALQDKASSQAESLRVSA